MAFHFIAMGYSSKLDKRLAFHYASDTPFSHNKTASLIKKIDKISKRNGIGIHIFSHQGKTWNDVIEWDAYFENYEVVKDLEEFCQSYYIDDEEYDKGIDR